MSQNVDPDNAPVWSTKEEQPYANRSVKSIIFVFVAFVLMIALIIYILVKPENNDPQNMNRAQIEKDRSGFYYVMRDLFAGAEDGLDDNPHNLSNVKGIDQFNLNTDNTLNSDSDAGLKMLRAKKSLQSLDDNYRHSVLDVIGSDVRGSRGENSGRVFDILIHKKTGHAKTIIMAEDETMYSQDLIALKFEKIALQKPNGDVISSITEDAMEDKASFDYSKIGDDYLSLKRLRHGQLLDDEGNVAGQIDAVIYTNAEVQKIYFSLAPKLSPNKKKITFGLPYDQIKVVENPDGYDVVMTKEQTKELAEALY